MSIREKLSQEIRSRVMQWLDIDTGLPRIGHNYPPPSSGVQVTETSAMRLSAVFACVRLLSWTLASLPLPVYKRLNPRGKERAPYHPLYSLLHDKPNSEQTSFKFRSLVMAHACLWGNGYAEIGLDQIGNIESLWPIPPWRVDPKRGANRELYYEIRLPDGTTDKIPAYKMLHFTGLGLDGDKGLSPIGMAREGIGLAMAAEQFGGLFYGQGANMGGVVEHPGKLKSETATRLSEDINEKHAGLGKTHRIMLLEEGMKYTRVGIPPNDAQFIESRKFQVTDIARLFAVPPHMIADLEKATFSNIEHQDIGFVKHTMRHWFVNWEQEIKFKLLLGEDYFAEFLIEGLLRGDIASRYASYSIGRQWGWLNADDIRELENMNPLPDGQGKIYLVPMNMIPAEEVIDSFSGDGDLFRSQKLNLSKEYRSANSRSRIARRFRRVFADAAGRIIKREEADVMRTAKKLLGERSRSAFLEWLETFYRDHPEYIRKQMLPPVTSLAEAIQEELAGEIDTKAGMTPELEKFIVEYIDTYTTRHTERSLGQLKDVMSKAFDKGEDEIEALQERFDEWGERRPSKIAREETVRSAGAVAIFVIGAAGFTKLVYRAVGSKSCPFCQQLDGKVVGIEQPFINAGDELEADDGSGMKVYGPKFHPPIHDGCECQVGPG